MKSCIQVFENVLISKVQRTTYNYAQRLVMPNTRLHTEPTNGR